MKTQKLKWVLLFVAALFMASCAARHDVATSLSGDDATKLPAVRVITMADCTSARLGTTIPAEAIGEPVSAVTLSEPVWTDAADGASAFCSVDGRMDPIDTSETAQPINFRVVLPASWRMRSVQMGGAGMNGTIPRLSSSSPSPMPGPMMPEGFAAYGSDSGHSSDPRWALNDEAIRNLGYMQLKKTHDAAMVLMARMYGEKPMFNYFIGGSQGGREALTVAQRYPADYDGISASVPIVNFSTLMLAPYLIHIQQKPLESWVPAKKSNAVAWEFIRQCDGLDGLKDGLINNYTACRAIFNVNDGDDIADPWRAKRCDENIDPNPDDRSINACFTDEQIETLEFIFSTYKFPTPLANGVTSFGMWAPTTEPTFTLPMPSGGPPAGGRPGGMAPPGGPPGGMPQGMRPGGMPGTSPGAEGGPVAGMPARMPAGMPDMGLLSRNRYKGQEGAPANAPEPFVIGSAISAFLSRDLGTSAMDFVEGGESAARRVELSKWLDSTDSDLSAFYKEGGKMIVAMGTSDTIASSGAQLDYYQSVIDTMGQSTVDAFARLYVVPHGGHGLSGKRFSFNGDGEPTDSSSIPSTLDRFALLQNWVERGVAPGKSEVVTGNSGSLPMCSYPEYPKFVSGDPSKASSYTCALPK